MNAIDLAKHPHFVFLEARRCSTPARSSRMKTFALWFGTVGFDGMRKRSHVDS